MKIFLLCNPDLLSPFWLNEVRIGQHTVCVTEDRTVTIKGETLRFRGDAPLPGTMVEVWLNGAGFFVCATPGEIQRDAQARSQSEAEASAYRHAVRNAARIDAETFNSRIMLPVNWGVGIKDTLSGLSENSWGDGRNRATVEHIYLFDALEIGKLKRKAGDFLCTSASNSNGKRWSGIVAEHHVDSDGNQYQPKVTCKACLARAQRYMKK